MKAIKEFLILVSVSGTLSAIAVFSVNSEDYTKFVEYWSFIIVFYYLYTGKEEIFDVSKSSTVSKKLIAVTGILVGSKLLASLLTYVALSLMGI